MGLIGKLRRWAGGSEPTLIDYETLEQAATGTDGPAVLRKVGPGGLLQEPGSYKLQQSYDALLGTVQELRASLDGQAKRQEELLTRLSTLPHAVEALPQTSKMQSDLLRMINERLALHGQQQQKLSEAMNHASAASKGDLLEAIREQMETGNEIDRQLVESFNRFSMMIDRLQSSNNQALDCLQQVRDSYASSAMQMQEWIEKSRNRNQWLSGAALLFSTSSLLAVLVLLWALFHK